MAAREGEALLRRELGLALGIFVVINATIGTGIFRTPAKIARLVGSEMGYVAVWLAGAVIAVAGALTIAELAAAMPRTGGMYEWLRRTYGRVVAFVFGWTALLLLVPSAVGGFAKLGAEAVESLLGLPPNPTRQTVLAVGIVAGAAAANLAGVRQSATGQSLIAVAKYAGVISLGVLGLALPTSGLVAVPADMPAVVTPTLLTAMGALVSVMWAHDGWSDLSRISGEVKDPARNLPRALVLGTLAIFAVYLVANLGYLAALGIDGLRRSTTGSNMAAANLARLTLGDVRPLSAVILLSCVGAAMTTLLTSPRVFVAMASDGLFFRAVGAVSPRTGTPARAVLVCAGFGAVYVSYRSFEQLTEGFVAGYFPFYILTVLAVPILRRREPDVPRPFRVPLYPLPLVLFLVGAFALLAGAAMDADRSALLALGVLAAGIPVGIWWARRPG